LRDTTGNTRFVCIPVQQPLPLDWAAQNRNAIWSRAVEQYRAGVSWQECDTAERNAIADRNDNYQEQDPWLPVVQQHLVHSAAEDRLPVQVPELLDRIGVPQERQSTREAKRVQQLAESLGWQQDRRRVGGVKVKGLWPHRAPLGHTSGTPPTPNQRNGFAPVGTPGTPKPKELETEETEIAGGGAGRLRADTFEQNGVPGVSNPSKTSQHKRSGGVPRCAQGVPSKGGGVPTPVGSGADAFGDDDDPHWPAPATSKQQQLS
jgi:hypothetical protein